MGGAPARREGNLCWIHFMSVDEQSVMSELFVWLYHAFVLSLLLKYQRISFFFHRSPPDSMLSTIHNKTSGKFPAWTSLYMQSPVCLTVSQYQNYMFPRTAFRMCNLKWYFQELFCLQSAESGIWAFLTNTEKTYWNKMKNFIGKGV